MVKTLGVILILLFLIFAGCTNTLNESKNEKPSLRLGIQNAPMVALPWIAYEKNFFKEEELNVEVQEFTTGAFALQALLAGSLDIATPAEVPPTLALMQGNTGKFAIIGQGVEKTRNEVRVVARKDGELKTAEEYFKSKKRKLATAVGTGAEFFTYNFLKMHGISSDEVEIISQKPADMPAALASGSVDAVSIFEPFAYFSEERTGNTITFKEDGIYSELYVFAMSKNFLDKNPEAAEKFLRAIVKAEKFVEENPEEAKEIVSRKTKLDKKVLDEIWHTFEFKLALTPSLLEYMEAEAAWAKETGKVPTDAKLPEFKEFINTGPLKKVKPEAVKVEGLE